MKAEKAEEEAWGLDVQSLAVELTTSLQQSLAAAGAGTLCAGPGDLLEDVGA